MPKISRRDFLRSAGGVTFLALVPAGKGLFALATENRGHSPLLFTALPYIQPGSAGHLVEGREGCVVAWQTEPRNAFFSVEFGPTKSYGHHAAIDHAERLSGEGEHRFNYAAHLTGLQLGRRYFYRVHCDGRIILEGFFTTRQPRGQRIRFVSFGDNSCGNLSDHAIAYQAYRAHPDFVLNTGDNVYDSGLDSEYARYFFPVYNADTASPRVGAPLLRSVPFFTVMANHDVRLRDSRGRSVGNFDREAGALAYYTNMHLPLNGPMPSHATPIVGAAERLAGFRGCAGERFPRMANYSFDSGDAHFLCLDSNIYVDPTDAALQNWIARDLSSTNARWKFVNYHHPAFNVGMGHYGEQHMRALAPLFEKHGVDFVLSGHEHSYQRARPLRFAPSNLARARAVHDSDRMVPGKFTVDHTFNGSSHTQPNGVIYIVTGAGGNTLYSRLFTDQPSLWTHDADNNVAYVAKFVADRHSLSLFDIEGHTLTMKQIDEYGDVIDTIRVTKA